MRLMESPSQFQARAVLEGQTAQEIAARVLHGCGFTILQRNLEHADSGEREEAIARLLDS